VASLSQGRTAAAQCGLFTYKSVPVIFEPPCIYNGVLQYSYRRRGDSSSDTFYMCYFMMSLRRFQIALSLRK